MLDPSWVELAFLEANEHRKKARKRRNWIGIFGRKERCNVIKTEAVSS